MRVHVEKGVGMAVLYEDSFVLLREASALMDQVLLQTADPNASGKIRAAFYKLYQAANSATMISPPDVRAVAEGGGGVPPADRGMPVQALSIAREGAPAPI